MIVMGLGLSLTAAILSSINERRSGIASAVNNAVSSVAGLLVVAMPSTIVGGSLDLPRFHSAALVTATLMTVVGGVSWIRGDCSAAGSGD